MEITRPSASRRMPRTPVESRPLKTRTSVHGEADRLAARCRQQDIVLIGANRHIDDLIALGKLHRDLAVAVDVGEIGKRVTPHVAGHRCKHQLKIGPRGLIFR